MCSPKVKKSGKFNPFYEFMREVTPGDIAFSFADTLIKAIGIAKSSCSDCPKPPEFAAAGNVWVRKSIRALPARTVYSCRLDGVRLIWGRL